MKTIRSYLALAAIILLAGCGSAKESAAPAQDSSGQAPQEAAAAGQSVTEQTTAGQSGEAPQDAVREEAEKANGSDTSAEAAQTAKKQETVTIVIPAVYESVKTQEEAEKIRKENGYESAVLNEDDGSLSIVMSRSQYDEMLDQFRKSVDEGVAEIIASVEDSAIEKIEYNDEYSIFTVTVPGDELGIAERQAAEELVMYGTLYHIYTGNDVDHIQVDYVKSGTGEVIDTADSGSLEKAY